MEVGVVRVCLFASMRRSEFDVSINRLRQFHEMVSGKLSGYSAMSLNDFPTLFLPKITPRLIPQLMIVRIVKINYRSLFLLQFVAFKISHKISTVTKRRRALSSPPPSFRTFQGGSVKVGERARL